MDYCVSSLRRYNVRSASALRWFSLFLSIQHAWPLMLSRASSRRGWYHVCFVKMSGGASSRYIFSVLLIIRCSSLAATNTLRYVSDSLSPRHVVPLVGGGVKSFSFVIPFFVSVSEASEVSVVGVLDSASVCPPFVCRGG